MAWYRSGTFQILMLLVLLGVVLLIADSVSGQTADPGRAGGAADAATTEVASSPYFLVLQSGVIGLIILLCSVVAVALIIQGFIRVRQPVLVPAETTQRMRELIAQRNYRDLMELTESDPSFVSKALQPALRRAPSFNAMKEAMETSVAEQSAEQFRKLEYLNILANIGPLLGLLGTVIGIMTAFLRIQTEGGQANPAQLAGGISIALGTTMLGLMMAIPCLVAYGILRTKVDRLTTQGAMEAEELLLLMVKPAETNPAPAAQRMTPSQVPSPDRKSPAPAPASAHAPAPNP